MDINKYVADKIKYYRIKRNLSQEEVAEELETSAVNISRYENGDRKTNQDILFKLSQLFGVSINDLTRENIHDLFTMVLQDTWLFNGSV